MPGVRHRIGGYRVIAPIGAGGFATVFRALDEQTGQEVAIKVLAENHSLVPDTRRRFEEEMGLLMTIKSPTIAKIYKVGETEAGQPFMVLELADRGDLRTRLKEIRDNDQILNREDLTMLASHLHESLRHLHGLDIVHRDVSPGNILIRSRRNGGARTPGVTLLEAGERFLLTDLGHAKDMILASGFTAGGGTRGFASPEQREDVAVVDHRADIFAATAIMEWASHDGLYAEALEPFVNVGFAADPDDRFDTMEEWYTAFSDTMAATLLDGSQASKVGRVMRRLKPGQTRDIDQIDIDQTGLGLHRPELYAEMVLEETAVHRPPGGITPPSRAGLTRVVPPPGSPGAQSIGRPDYERPTDGTDAAEAGADGGLAEPDFVDVAAATAATAGDQRRSGRWRSRRLALAVGVVVVVAAALAVDWNQELADRTVNRDNGGVPSGEDRPAEESGSAPPTSPTSPTSAMIVTSDSDSAGANDSDWTDGGRTPIGPGFGVAEARLNTAPDTAPATAERGSGRADAEPPGVIISAPEPGATLPLEDLRISGVITAADRFTQVEVTIQDVDTEEYWSKEAGRFVPDFATVTVSFAGRNDEDRDDAEVVVGVDDRAPDENRAAAAESADRPEEDGAEDNGADRPPPAWSVTVPVEALRPGTYEIRVFLGPTWSVMTAQPDNITVTVLGDGTGDQ